MTMFRQRLGAIRVRRRALSSRNLGAVMIAVILLIVLGLSQMEKIRTWLRPGDTVRVNFAQNYRLQDFVSEVKVAGVLVGVLQSVERTEDGTALAELKVDSGVTDILGSSPSAVIRPTTILGGKYYIALEPGGAREPFTGTIPVDDTRIPVELQQLTSTLQPEAIDGIQTSTRALDRTLNARGQQAVDELLRHAPQALEPAAEVLRGMQGTEPERDLAALVHGLESTSRTLNEREGELESIVRNMHTVSATLDDRSADLAASLRDLSETLETTKSGLLRLDRTLARLRATSGPARPFARKLDTTLAHLDPVLARTQPLMSDLRRLLSETRPLVEQLVPTTRDATSALDDVRGPVLDRVNGPIKKMVLTPFKGSGVYEGGGSDKPLYQEIGYMFAGMGRASQIVDKNGTAVGLQPGFGGALISGTPINFERLLDTIGRIKGGTPEQREGR